MWSTYLGSCCFNGLGYTTDVAVDTAGNVHVVGFANEPGWPTTPDAYQPDYVGPWPYSDTAFTKFDAFGEALVYSTWIGGNGTDNSGLIGLDGQDRAHVVFEASDDITTTPGVYQHASNGNDLLIARFDIPVAPYAMLGGGLAGSVDVPNLAGDGPLEPGSTTRVSVRGGNAGATSWLVAGFSRIDEPLLGGTLVPATDVLIPLSTDPDGSEKVGGVPAGSISTSRGRTCRRRPTSGSRSG